MSGPRYDARAMAWPVAFALGALATWRITHLAVNEDGPADVVVRVRRAAGSSALGRAMDCFYCASMWTALPVALALTRDPASTAPWRRGGASRRVIWPRRVAIWLALSGAACLLERTTRSGSPGGPDARRTDEPHAAQRQVPGAAA